MLHLHSSFVLYKTNPLSLNTAKELHEDSNERKSARRQDCCVVYAQVLFGHPRRNRHLCVGDDSHHCRLQTSRRNVPTKPRYKCCVVESHDRKPTRRHLDDSGHNDNSLRRRRIGSLTNRTSQTPLLRQSQCVLEADVFPHYDSLPEGVD